MTRRDVTRREGAVGGGRARASRTGSGSQRRRSAMAATVQDVLSSRSGAVLGPRACIKSDHFPGCQKENLDAPKLNGGTLDKKKEQQ